MSNPPVILQILPELNSGGVERGTLEIAKAIVEAGGKALVVSSGGRLEERLKASGAIHITLPVASKNPFRIWRNIAALKDIIREHKVHLVHARSRAPAWSAYFAAKQCRVPFVTTFHGTYGVKGLGKKKYNEVMVYGQKIIAVSNHIKKHILQHYDVDESRIQVVHRGVELSQFSSEHMQQNQLESLIQDWHLEDVDKPIIFFPGRVTRWKGQHIALQALARLGHKRFICLFAGDADKHPRYVKELHEQVNLFGLELNVRFVPATPFMAEAYHLSDLVLSPAIEPEAFGRVPVEAGAMERICIATSHGGAMETIQHGETGYVVPPDNAEKLADAINYVLSLSDEQKAPLQQKARAHVSEHFSVATMQNKTLDLYEEAMRARR